MNASDKTDLQRWRYYIYANNVLKNKYNITDNFLFKERWYDDTEKRIKELRNEPIYPKSGIADLDYMRQLHRYINQDAFIWAGELRQVDMRKKGESRSSFVHWRNIEFEAKKITERYAAARHFEGLGKAEFTERIAEFAADWNRVHPFREGNGRTNKVFLSYVCERAGYRLDLGRVSKEEWNEAFRAEAHGDKRPLQDVFGRMVRPERSVAFESWPREASLARHAELSTAYGYMQTLTDKAKEAGISAKEVDMAAKQLKTRIVATLDTGKVPGQERKTEQGKASGSSAEPDLER